MAREFKVDGLPALAAQVLELADEGGEKPLIWYRGVSCDRHALAPKLLRGRERAASEVNEREARLLTRFRQRSLAYWPSGYPQTPWSICSALLLFPWVS